MATMEAAAPRRPVTGRAARHLRRAEAAAAAAAMGALLLAAAAASIAATVPPAAAPPASGEPAVVRTASGIAVPAAPAAGPEAAASAPARPLLLIPVEGVAAAALRDTFGEPRGDAGRRHEAIDIAAPRGTPVLAVDDGPVVKLFTSRAGGLTVYQFDRDGRLAYYYAHLDRYADGLTEGMTLARGDPVGHVGSTGNAAHGSPHLHFAVFRLGPQRRWWQGTPVDPYPLLVGRPTPR